MASWAERKAAEVIAREGLSPLAGAAFLAGITEAIEEAARRCEQANTNDVRHNGAASSEAAATAGASVLAMLADDGGEATPLQCHCGHWPDNHNTRQRCCFCTCSRYTPTGGEAGGG
jgi:hypothetical protein